MEDMEKMTVEAYVVRVRAHTHTHTRTHARAHTHTHTPQNLYRLTQDYFRERRAVISFNSNTVEKNINKGCPQGSCCGHGFWNIQYNSLLTLKYTNHTKAVAFADDLFMIKAESIRT
jgi:hypothetical protein